MRQVFHSAIGITKWDDYYKVRHKVYSIVIIRLLQSETSVRQVFHSAIGITKWDDYHKVDKCYYCDDYYKVRQVLL